MTLAHPALPADGRLRNRRILKELKNGLPPEDVDAALARGAELDVELLLAQVDAWILNL